MLTKEQRGYIKQIGEGLQKVAQGLIGLKESGMDVLEVDFHILATALKGLFLGLTAADEEELIKAMKDEEDNSINNITLPRF